ncbi:tryptophan--tRNA ligase [Desulforamulus hydrothermalis]|uniref:Tryptophan--tRNA ligase n=1 Tax=Desulforamulus hydrothermalis Lam5 = DSM 18033 TaxID=1121428 RepID=K8EKB6_9FIRM|nr:tryptophan--tRNA ligase [Desulforamulus hydrothermalis]CCO08996.1 Tryptophan--tRNA ligase [Desulforamulus hydrothermalis Lam5 = DSM 18033]SHG76519.1 tryptophanyl-tRNA synthetase [Desulforamulus hydrothermalis Lam5 = DSM 18033]
MTNKGTILSGMRPTGRLHLGHQSVLDNWVDLQDQYNCFFMVADLHALTTGWEEARDINRNTLEMVADWLASGLDPEKSAIFRQSNVLQHAELHLMLSMVTPLSWLERVPTYKDQIQKLGEMGKDINTYGFLGYPLLMAADILLYKANAVPVGEDQLPHIELTREVARRFNHLFKPVFPEPQGIVKKEVAVLPGIDGAKMSKSYHNYISIGADPEEIQKNVNLMVTDPARIRKTDPGNPEVCVVHKFHRIYNRELLESIEEACRGGRTGCVACKKQLAGSLEKQAVAVRARRQEILSKPSYIEEVLRAGEAKARQVAGRTMQEVREAVFGS